ncbi:hypothetical protein BLSTO_06342 [Blastocystis sp. subtype 1]
MPWHDDLDEEFDFQETIPENDVALLKMAYKNELIAPELLDYKLDLISSMKQKLDLYVESLLPFHPVGIHN